MLPVKSVRFKFINFACSKGQYSTLKISLSGIDLNLFKPLDKLECRKKLGLPYNKKLILFTASPNHPRKRFHLAQQAIDILKNKFDCELVICTNQTHKNVVLFMNAAD